jgi:hypothetical protein
MQLPLYQTFSYGRPNSLPKSSRFVIRLKDGETMAALCREFGISRKTGYKIFERYEQCGLEGLSDRTDTRSGSLCHARQRQHPCTSRNGLSMDNSDGSGHAGISAWMWVSLVETHAVFLSEAPAVQS